MAPSAADIDKILNLINAQDIESLKKEDYDIFQYQGFDPYRLIEALMAMKDSNKVSDAAFADDICKMVAIGLIKGNVTDHNIKKMSDAGQTDLTELIKKYKLKTGGGKNQPSNIITFPRVMACFPDIAVRLTKVIGGKEFRGGPFSSYTLPAVMQVQVFPSVIPSDLDSDVKKFFLTASLCYSIDQTIQITDRSGDKEKEKPDLVSLAASQSSFVSLSHTSPIPKMDQRKKVFNQLGLPSQYSRIRSVVDIYIKIVDSKYVCPDEKAYKTALALV